MSPFHCDCILSSINDSSLALVWLGVVLGIIALCCKFIFLDKREPGARILSVTNRYIHLEYIYRITFSCTLTVHVCAMNHVFVTSIYKYTGMYTTGFRTSSLSTPPSWALWQPFYVCWSLCCLEYSCYSDWTGMS